MTNEPQQNDNQPQQAPLIDTVTARTSTLMGPRTKLGLAFVLVAAALAYFAFTAFEGATVDYL